MRHEINALLRKALEAVPLFLCNEQQQVQRAYRGHAASLGAAIRTAGLLPALVFYTDEGRSEEDAARFRLLHAIAYCLELPAATETSPSPRLLLDTVLPAIYGSKALTLEKRYDRKKERFIEQPRPLGEPDPMALRLWSDRIVHASIALKLAIRNFPHSEENLPTNES